MRARQPAAPPRGDPVRAVCTHVVDAMRIVQAAFGNADLRRVEIAFLAFNMAEYGTWIAIMVFAYSVGGATAAGVIGAVQLVPAALCAPFAAILGDRYRRDRVLWGGYVAQALAMGVTGAALLGHAPVALIYALAAVTATSVTATRPVQGALLPGLVRSVEELTAANVTAGWIEGVGIMLGPLLTGLLLRVATPGAVFVVMGALLLGAALLVGGIEAAGDLAGASRQESDGSAAGGFRSLATERSSRLVVALMGAQFVLIGSLDVLLVVLAFRLLGIGGAGVGVLNAVFGLGALIGAGVTGLLVARRRLLAPLLAGALIWGVGLAPLGAMANPLVAACLVAVAGVGRPLVDVTGRMLLQRIIPDHMLARVFGVLEGLAMAALAVGALIVPVLLAAVGVRATFLVAGAFLPVLALLAWRPLTAIEAATVVPSAEVAVLRALPLFAPLSALLLESLAAHLIPLDAPADAVLIKEGEYGDRFYVIAEGEVRVTKEGRPLATLGPGDFFGEIALLHDIPRTATVTVQTRVRLYALERRDFLEALTGHPQSAATAAAVAVTRLDEQRTR